MKPDSTKHNKDPKYLRSLIEGANITQEYAAKRIDISPRTMRAYLSGSRTITYRVQFAIEMLCHQASA